MLFGEFNHSIDAKNRMFIPAKFREELGASFVIFKSVREKYIKLMSLTEWENYVAPIKALDRKIAEKTMRHLTKDGTQVTPDAQGRIVIPQGLIDFAEIKKDAVVVGCGDYAEIWAQEVYDLENEEEDAEEIRKALEECGL